MDIRKKLLDNYNNLSIAARAAVWFTMCNIFLKGISFFTTPLFTRLLSTDEYGLLSLYTSFEHLILVIATWEVSIGPYQRGLFKYKDDVKTFTASTQIFANMLTLITFAAIMINFELFASLTNMTSGITVLLFVYLLLQPAYSCWFYRQRVRFDYKKTVLATIFITIVAIVIPLIAVLTIDNTAKVKYSSYLVSMIIIYSFFYVKGLYRSSIIKNWKNICVYWKFFICFTPPLVVHAISYYILGQADRVMIAKMIGTESAAIYSVAYTIAGMTIIVQSAIQQVLVPWIYQNLEEGKYMHIKKNASLMFASLGVIYLLFILISPEVLKIMYPHAYYDGIWCIPPIAIGSYFMFLYTMFVNVESYYQETKYIAYVSISCALINIVLNYFGMQIMNYIVCAYTTLISYILFAIGHFYFMKKIVKKHANSVKIFDGKLILAIAIIILILMGIITWLYDLIIIRYIFILAIIIICFLNRKNLIKIMEQFNFDKN